MIYHLLNWCTQLHKTQHHFCGILIQNAQPEFKHEKISGKPKLKDILQDKSG